MKSRPIRSARAIVHHGTRHFSTEIVSFIFFFLRTIHVRYGQVEFNQRTSFTKFCILLRTPRPIENKQISHTHSKEDAASSEIAISCNTEPDLVFVLTY